MKKDGDAKKDAISFIKQKIRMLNAVVFLILTALLLVVVRFLYTLLDYIPPLSFATVLSIVAGLIVIGVFTVKSISGKAIDAIEEYARKQAVLLSTTRKMHSLVHIDTILNNIVDTAIEITGADAGSLLLVEGEGLVFKTVKGRESQKLVGFSFPKSEGIAGSVIASGELVRIDNAQNDNRFFQKVDEITNYSTRNILCAPLLLKDRAIGALELVNKKSGPFTREDEEFLAYFAEQAAISIEKGRFFEDERNYEIYLTNLLIEAMENMPAKKGHSRRVAKYTLLMARALNMTEPEKKRLYQASLLHDIGFLKIAPNVVSIEEFQMHADFGYELLKPINFYSDIAPIIRHHHERYDGTGYPDQLKGESIPIESRMIYIAEAFDAIVSGNSYKKIGKVIFQNIQPDVTGYRGAIDELKKNAGTQFDAELVQIFIDSIDEDYAEAA